MDQGFELLARQADIYKRYAFAESTKCSYRSQINSFLRFCIYFDRPHLPADQQTLKCYVAFLARTLNPSSIGGYLNVIRILHLNSGLPNPLEGNWEITMMKRGISRRLGRPVSQKLPITLDLLSLIFELLDISNPRDLSFWTACLICFYGLLRKNTLLPPSVASSSPAFLIRSDIVSVTGDSFLLRVRQTKTIQFGQRVLVLPFVRCANESFCPVTFLLRHLVASPLAGTRSLFSYMTGKSEVVWTHASFVVFLLGLRFHLCWRFSFAGMLFVTYVVFANKVPQLKYLCLLFCCSKSHNCLKNIHEYLTC